MEPNLQDIEDYKKPLSSKKIKTIAIAFGALFALYFIVTSLLELFVG